MAKSQTKVARVAEAVQAMLSGFIQPGRLSERKRDELVNIGCEAGNRLRPLVRKIKLFADEPMEGMHTLEVTLKGGELFFLELQQS